MNENKHLEAGGILDCFTRRCIIIFSRMLFEELTETFNLFDAFRIGEIPSEHPINAFLDEQTATNTVFSAKPTVAATQATKSTGTGIGHFLK